jgi:hypothetical protein
MGMHLPADRGCHVVAVEIADNMTFSEELTSELQAALPRIVADVKTHILMTLVA